LDQGEDIADPSLKVIPTDKKVEEGKGKITSLDDVIEAEQSTMRRAEDKGLDLDFRGTGDKDRAAVELYKEYLLLYGILRERHEEAIGLFGTEYGYGKLQTPSSVKMPFGSEQESILEYINKALYPE